MASTQTTFTTVNRDVPIRVKVSQKEKKRLAKQVASKTETDSKGGSDTNGSCFKGITYLSTEDLQGGLAAFIKVKPKQPVTPPKPLGASFASVVGCPPKKQHEQIVPLNYAQSAKASRPVSKASTAVPMFPPLITKGKSAGAKPPVKEPKVINIVYANEVKMSHKASPTGEHNGIRKQDFPCLNLSSISPPKNFVDIIPTKFANAWRTVSMKTFAVKKQVAVPKDDFLALNPKSSPPSKKFGEAAVVKIISTENKSPGPNENTSTNATKTGWTKPSTGIGPSNNTFTDLPLSHKAKSKKALTAPQKPEVAAKKQEPEVVAAIEGQSTKTELALTTSQRKKHVRQARKQQKAAKNAKEAAEMELIEEVCAEVKKEHEALHIKQLAAEKTEKMQPKIQVKNQAVNPRAESTAVAHVPAITSLTHQTTTAVIHQPAAIAATQSPPLAFGLTGATISTAPTFAPNIAVQSNWPGVYGMVPVVSPTLSRPFSTVVSKMPRVVGHEYAKMESQMALQHGFDNVVEDEEGEPQGGVITESIVVGAQEIDDRRDELEINFTVGKHSDDANDDAEVDQPAAEHQNDAAVVPQTKSHNEPDQRDAGSLSVVTIENTGECDADNKCLCDMALADLAVHPTASTKVPKEQLDALQQVSLYRRGSLAHMGSDVFTTFVSCIAARYGGSVKSKNGKPLVRIVAENPSHKRVETVDRGRGRTDSTSIGDVVLTSFLQQLATKYPGRSEYTEEQIAAIFTNLSKHEVITHPAQPRDMKANRDNAKFAQKFRWAMKLWTDFDG
ncbi:hypothetical protein TW65_07194 [Stemphylium lycopersici]|nr:hypothetical protein TW65_07194 [Stemphylium lycopersici]